ncbi:MAG: 2-hydroxyacyl-CoA dehydratase subunit D [Anaerolineae bacterium]
MEPILAQFVEVTTDPYHNWPNRFPGRRAFGYISTYVPEEILHAAGYTPIQLFGRRGSILQAEAHLQSFTCWPARSVLDQALEGRFDFLEGVALAHTCDALHALSEIWREAVPHCQVLNVGQPLNLESPSTRPYLMAELQNLVARLGQRSGQEIGGQTLWESIHLYNQTRSLIQRLYELSSILPSPAFFSIVQAAHLMPKDEYNQLLAQLLAVLEGTKGHGPASGPKLIVVGPVLDDEALYRAIAEAGGQVVDDMLDLGHLYFQGLVEDGDDPLAALADRYLSLVPIPSKHHPGLRRDKQLLDLIARREAEGVIFAPQKFCESHSFDYVILKRALDQTDVPHLLVEIEQAQVTGQTKTRLRAFIEMLTGEKTSEV